VVVVEGDSERAASDPIVGEYLPEFSEGVVRQPSVSMEEDQYLATGQFGTGITLDAAARLGNTNKRAKLAGNPDSIICAAAISDDYLYVRIKLPYAGDTAPDNRCLVQNRDYYRKGHSSVPSPVLSRAGAVYCISRYKAFQDRSVGAEVHFVANTNHGPANQPWLLQHDVN